MHASRVYLHRTSTVNLTSITNAHGHATLLTSYDANGRPLSIQVLEGDIATPPRPSTRPRGQVAPVRVDEVSLPSDVTVEAVLAAYCKDQAAGANIIHLASGMSCGGVIALTGVGMAFQIRVNWLTGGAEVVPIK